MTSFWYTPIINVSSAWPWVTFSFKFVECDKEDISYVKVTPPQRNANNAEGYTFILSALKL